MIVDGFNRLLRALVAGYAEALGALPPWASLGLAAALLGAGTLWVVGRTSDQPAIARARKRLQAHLLEMRLYRDEPRILLRAQGRLLLDHARRLRLMLRPALFLALPTVLLYGHFDAVYGRRALRVGESALLTAATELPGRALALTGSAGFEVASVSVEARAARQVSWRVRAVAAGPGVLALATPEGRVEKAAVAEGGLQYLSPSRRRSWWERLLLAPGENGYSAASVAAVHLEYPARTVGVAGWETHWGVWFLAVSLTSAYLLKGFFGVVV